IDPPAGEVPVEWILATSEPIETEAQVLAIIDRYRARWPIEEFFKAINTGCAFEARQLESLDALLIALSLMMPIATNMLLLRTLERQAPQTPAEAVLDHDLIEALRHTGRSRLP